MRSLASFLTVGYFLDYKDSGQSLDLGRINKQMYAGVGEQALIRQGTQLWREAITANFDSARTHVVPLSGGLDSRAVLAGLLEHTDARNVHTYTFGTPGTLDFEIGSYVARKLGTRHTSFDLTRHTYRQDELEDISRRVDRQTVLFHHCPVWDADRQFAGALVWTGYLGDPVSGSHLPKDVAPDLTTAAVRFIEKNRYVKSIDLCPNSPTLTGLLELPSVESDRLTFEEQLDLKNRQAKFVAPHVMMKGFEYRAPFQYQPWIDFMLSLDNQHRKKQSLYKKILLHSFPSVFALRSKTNYGLPINAPAYQQLAMRMCRRIQQLFGATSWRMNYLDFDDAIRKKSDLRRVVEMNIADLQRRQLIDWLDISSVLQAHQTGRANHADALLVLTSLEIHLKTGLVL